MGLYQETTESEIPGDSGFVGFDHNLVLVVDDDEVLCKTFSLILSLGGYKVMTAGTGGQARAILSDHQPSVLLLDLRLPDMSGLALLADLSRSGSRIRVIVMTGCGDVGSTVAAMKLGAADFVEKPLFEEDLLQIVERVLSKSREARQATLARAAEQVGSRLQYKVLRFIDETIGAGTEVSLGHIAEHVGLSPWYLSRTFRRETGIKLTAFIRHRRAMQALKVLRHPDTHLRDAARAAGYKSESDLCRDFKRVFGQPPLAYLRRK